MSRYKDEVYKTYRQLTDEQLQRQRDKFKDSKVVHELGKYVQTVEEMNRRQAND